VEEEKKPAEILAEAVPEVIPGEATPVEEVPVEATPAEEVAAEVLPPRAAATAALPEEAGSSQNDRNLAALAHGGTLLNVVFPGLGILAALLIWLSVKERSRYAGFQSLQAVAFQVAALLATVLGGILVVVGWVVSALLVAVAVGCLLMPFALLLTLAVILMAIAALVYGLFGAYEVYNGRDFRYWLVGEWLEQEQAR